MLESDIIDNSSLIPPIEDVPPSEWCKSLILIEVHLSTAMPEGSFASARKVLDHCAEMGVNGIWLTPIYRTKGGNGYSNCGPHTVEPALSGAQDDDGGWRAVKSFVDEAHGRGIRILLDLVTWGTIASAPICAEHPEWFSGTAWGGAAFNWKCAPFVEWFVSVAVANIMRTGADGYRCDCEPGYAGYGVFAEIRRRCESADRRILIVGEEGCEHGESFDFEQDGVLRFADICRGDYCASPRTFYMEKLDIVDSVKTGDGIGSRPLQEAGKGGRYRFYTCCVTNHDFHSSVINGRLSWLAYPAIFAPFIPLWYFGEEFGLRCEKPVFYFVPVDWALLDDAANAKLYEDVKRCIRIRRSYPDIFECWPEDHREANIMRADAGTRLTAYARYTERRAIIVVPNDGAEPISTDVAVPRELGFAPSEAVDLFTDKRIPIADGSFSASVGANGVGVYLVEAQ